MLALHQEHLPVTRGDYPKENRLISRCLTYVNFNKVSHTPPPWSTFFLFFFISGFLLILWLDYLISLLQFSRNLSQLPKSWTRRDLAASEGNGSKSRVTTEEDSAPCSWEEERQKEQLTRILEVEEHGDESSDDDEIYVHEHLEDEVLMGWARIKEEQRLRYDRSKETLWWGEKEFIIVVGI